MVLILISGLIGTPTPALRGEGLVTLLGGGTLAALIAIESVWTPRTTAPTSSSCSSSGSPRSR